MELKRLGSWCNGQRGHYKKGNLSAHKIILLKQVGFCFNFFDSLWERNYLEIKYFKEKYGHCNVPHNYSENLKLGYWCITQRCYKKRGKLTNEQICLLDEIGFVWDYLEYTWFSGFEMLKAFKVSFGHVNVPDVYSENLELSSWCKSQKKHYKKNKVRADRLKLLDEIGFNFDPYETQFIQNYEKLKEFKKIHGHCDVPYSYTDCPSLGKWCCRRRSEYKKGKLSQDKIKILDDIGFSRDRINDEWNNMFKLLCEYKHEFGDCYVPQDWLKNQKLGNWCIVQRQFYRKGKMTKDRIKILESIGFDWDPLQSQWMVRFLELKEYKDKHGHCNVSKRCLINPQLATWVDLQRQRNRKIGVSPNNFSLLESIGFDWEPLETRWNLMYDLLKKFKQNNGHFNVPNKYSENPELRSWVGAQIRNKEKVKLSQDKIELLESIGFQWSVEVGEMEDV